MTNLTTKESYLAARAEWKANYAELTLQSRKLRREFNEAASAFGKTPYTQHTEYWASYRAMEALRDQRRALRCEANAQIAAYVSMKIDAALAWERARAIAA